MEQSQRRVVGKLPSSGSIAEIRFDAAIAGVDDLIHPPPTADWISPGLIDLQVNGFAGVDYNDPSSSAEDIAASIRTMFSTGVTRFLATVITGSRERMESAIRNLAQAKQEFGRHDDPAYHALEALHIEGPHISPEDGPRGAHPLEHIRPPDFEEFKRWQDAADGSIRLITISPEWDGTPAYIERIVREGVVASIGHTKANTAQIQAAVSAGATMSTHLGNASHPQLPKTQNYIWDQLAEDKLAACFIVDGIHIPPHFFRAAIRAKGVERSVLVSDAVMPAMCAPGNYELGQVAVELLLDGSVVLRGGNRLAGSALRMDHAVANSIRFGNVSLAVALAMASTNAARVGRIAGRQRGGLTPGERADLVRFKWNTDTYTIEIIETIVSGHLVYSAPAS